MEEHNSTHTLLSAQMKNLNVRLLLNLIFYGLKAGADPGFFFLRGGALVSCFTSTPINHIVFFWQNTSCIRKPRVISGEGSAQPPCTLPLDPPQ